MRTLAGILSSIPPQVDLQEGDLEYHVLRVPTARTHFFGRDSKGCPCLLLAATDGLPKAPLLLALIQVRYCIPCRIKTPDREDVSQTFTTVVCTTEDPVLQVYFAHACETILAIIGPEPTLQEIVSGVSRLVELFQRLTRPSTRSVTGLFAELFIISVCSSPKKAVEAWRSGTDERFDFSAGDVRVEVKASSTRQRAHNFSLEQCNPPIGICGVLVSIFIETSGGGLSLLELVERIEEQLDGDPNLVLKLQQGVVGGLGDTAGAAFEMRFDEGLARASLRVYELDGIPAIRKGVPNEVSQVHFRSDISRAQTADVATLVSRYGEVRALLPSKVPGSP